MERDSLTRRVGARLAVLVAVGALGCAPEEPRILATFQAGVETYNYSTQVGRPGFYYAPPTLVGDHVYIGTSRKAFEAPAEANGFFKLDSKLTKVWEYRLGRAEVRGPASVDAAGNVYFVVETGRGVDDWSAAREFLYSLDRDGAFRWQFEITGAAGANDGIGMLSPAIASDGTIYVGGGRLYALDPSGTKQWEFTPAGHPYVLVTNAPIIDPAGNLYFVSWRTVHSLRPDGTERWSFDTGQWDAGSSSPAFSVAFDRVYVAAGATLFCIDATSGAELWRNAPPELRITEGIFRATPAVDDADNVYVGTKADEESVFYAFGSDGAVLWQRKIGADLYSSPALGDDGALYVGSEIVNPGFDSHYGARFHALDRATGAERWSVELLGDVTWSSPALSDDGTIYVGTMAGFVYAIRSDASGLLPNAGSPRFHEGNGSSGRRE